MTKMHSGARQDCEQPRLQVRLGSEQGHEAIADAPAVLRGRAAGRICGEEEGQIVCGGGEVL